MTASHDPVPSILTVIGTMSGTSFDGVDVALMETDGEVIVRLGDTSSRPYTDRERAVLRQALAAAVTLTDRAARPGVIAEAEAIVTRAHAEAIAAMVSEAGLAAGEVDLIGFHGQTVLHRPEKRLTVQIGDAHALSRALGIPVVHDFRAADVASGGEGAPLAPVYHQALGIMSGLTPPFAILNMGGVGNITYVGAGEGDFLAFDTGPANALVDDLMARRTGARFDAGGETAARGQVNETIISHALTRIFFSKAPPKSLDRNDFSTLMAAVEPLSLEDAAATLTAFSAASVAAGFYYLPRVPTQLVVVGGGAHNVTLMRELGQRLPCPVLPAGELGWTGDAIEAQAFAYMAARCVRGLPISFPGTTGAPEPMTGGVMVQVE